MTAAVSVGGRRASRGGMRAPSLDTDRLFSHTKGMNAATTIDRGSESRRAQAGSAPGLVPPAGGPGDPSGDAPAPLATWLPPGGLVELSGGPGAARTSLAVSLVIHTQRAGEPVAWIEDADRGGLYPPDLAEAGVDLARLVVIRVPRGARRRGAGGDAAGLARAAELLLRSGGFGLVVLDLGAARSGRGTDVWLGRLAGLARRHGARVALRTEADADAGSLGPLVTTRIGAGRRRLGPGFHTLAPTVWKDKAGRAGARGAPADEPRRAPWGLEGPAPDPGDGRRVA